MRKIHDIRFYIDPILILDLKKKNPDPVPENKSPCPQL